MNDRTLWRSTSQLSMCQMMVLGTRVVSMTTTASPSSVLPQRILGKVASSGLSFLGVGVGPPSGTQPKSPRPSPLLTRKSLSPREG